jgi:hypothetical protein
LNESKSSNNHSNNSSLNSSGNNNSIDITMIQNMDEKYKESEINLLNAELLALECVLNLNMNKKNNETTSEWYKNELRDLKVLDKLLHILKRLVVNFKSSGSHNKNFILINKYAKYLHLIETVTQQSSLAAASNINSTATTTNNSPLKSASQSVQSSPKNIAISSSSSSNSIQGSKSQSNYVEFYSETHIIINEYDSLNTSSSSFVSSTNHMNASDAPISSSTLNQNYLIDFKQNFLVDLFKESLNLFYDELEALHFSKNKDEDGALKTNKNILTNAIKQTFLVMINLTSYNGKF